MTMPSDIELNAIGVLKRRAIEARIVAPLLEALGKEFGEARVREVARDVIAGIARDQGKALAKAAGDNSVEAFAASLDRWTADDALTMEMVDTTPGHLAFNVTRCRYAEMYRELGIPELGAVLSCNRDATLIEGFNPEVRFTRTQTLMGGAACCDFRYELRRAPGHDA